MEHDDKPLPIDICLLGALAEKVFPFLFSFGLFGCVSSPDAYVLLNFLTWLYWIFFLTFPYPFHVLLLFYTLQCRAFAKALHYKEAEFERAHSKEMDADPIAIVEALIHINNQLHQHEVDL